jgi:hypothetical protein
VKIELLWTRERFAGLFADAATRLLRAATGADHEIRWRRRRPLRPGDRDWVCSSRLNAIYWSRTSAATRAAIRRHYGNHPSELRAVAQRLYVAIATTGPGERAMRRWLTIDPLPAAASDLVFRGGGQRIRMMDYARGRVWAVAKAGRGQRGVTAEIAFRRQLPADFPAPELFGEIDGGRGLCEALAPGRPLDQLRPTAALDIRAAAERCLGGLARERRRAVDSASYLAGLGAQIDFQLGSELASVTLDGVVSGVLDRIRERVGDLFASSGGAGDIELAPCHGDLTGDNIIASGADFAITDWESAGERHIGFTWIEGAIAARRPGFGARLAALVGGGPTPSMVASARRLIDEPPPVGDRRWREIAALVYLAERLAIDAGTALAGHMHRAGPELALSAAEAEQTLDLLESR